MSWAARRRFFILLILGVVIVAFLAIVLISAIYKTPSCTDGVQNQDEAGIDCGGPCAYLCTTEVQAPIVLFTKVLQNGDGRSDVVAMVENKNSNAAAKNVPYSITLYGSDQLFIQKIDGTVDLPPRATEPIYIPGVASGEQKVASAFLEIVPSDMKWFTMTADSRTVPKVLSTVQSGTESAPRIEAILANPSGFPLTNIRIIVFVYDAHKDVIAASETVVPIIPAQGQSTATFTWNNAFSVALASMEVEPIIKLP